MAATHDAESERLRRPSPALPHSTDPLCGVFRSPAGRENRLGNLRRPGSAVMLLVVAQVSRALSAGLADRFAGLFRAFSVSDEHGQGAAARDCLPDRRDSPAF